MSSMNSARFTKTVEPTLVTIYDGVAKAYPTEHDKIFHQEVDTEGRRFVERTSITGLDPIQLKPEGAPVAFTSGGEGWTVRFLHNTFAIAYGFTEELMEDGEHERLGPIYARHMARAVAEGKEIYHVNFLNRAFSGSYVGYDGRPLCDTAHPFAGQGGSWSNKLATPANLSEAALEQLCVQVRTAKDEKGKPAALKTRKLLVAPANEFNAHRILNSALRSGTGNNDLNALKSMGMFPDGIMVVTRMTNDKAFFVLTDSEGGLTTIQRTKLKKGMEGDFLTGNMRFKARERYSVNWDDVRHIFGSEGI